MAFHSLCPATDEDNPVTFLSPSPFSPLTGCSRVHRLQERPQVNSHVSPMHEEVQCTRRDERKKEKRKCLFITQWLQFKEFTR